MYSCFKFLSLVRFSILVIEFPARLSDSSRVSESKFSILVRLFEFKYKDCKCEQPSSPVIFVICFPSKFRKSNRDTNLSHVSVLRYLLLVPAITSFLLIKTSSAYSLCELTSLYGLTGGASTVSVDCCFGSSFCSSSMTSAFSTE